MPNLFMVSGHDSIGAIVDFGDKMVALKKVSGKLDLKSGHFIKEMPEEAFYRATDNPTIKEAASAFAQNRRPRWDAKGLYDY